MDCWRRCKLAVCSPMCRAWMASSVISGCFLLACERIPGGQVLSVLAITWCVGLIVDLKERVATLESVAVRALGMV